MNHHKQVNRPDTVIHITALVRNLFIPASRPADANIGNILGNVIDSSSENGEETRRIYVCRIFATVYYVKAYTDLFRFTISLR